MSWILAEGADNTEVWVRANDIAEVQLGGEARALFRRRGHAYQYVVKDHAEVEKLEELVTRQDPPPQTVNVTTTMPPIEFRGLDELIARASNPPFMAAQQVAAPPPKPAKADTPREEYSAPNTITLKVLELLAVAPQWRPQLRQSLLAAGQTEFQARTAVGSASHRGLLNDEAGLLSLNAKGKAELKRAGK